MDPASTDPAHDAGFPDMAALVAGTVALMTAWADPFPQTGLSLADLRSAIARKVVSNLFFLQLHPHAGPELRQSLAHSHARWLVLAQGEPTAGPAAALTNGRAVH